MTNLTLDGVLAFPATPMTPSGEALDLPAYERLVDWLLDSGVHAIIALGSTGEFAYLTGQERRAVAEATVATVGGRAPSIVGVAALATHDATALAEHAAKVGADAVMLSIPTYYGLGAREVEQHVRAVARAAELPLILYNNPFTSKVDLTRQLLERLIDIDTLVAVKEATTDVNRIPLLQAASGDRLAILGGGFDPYALPALCLGARGWTTGMANLVPGHCVALYEAAVPGQDLAVARQIDRQLAPLANLLVELGLSVAVKAGLEILGRPAGAPRPPLLPLQSADVSRVGSDRDAVSPSQVTRFPGPPSEPGVRVTTHPALHTLIPQSNQPCYRLTGHGRGILAPR